MNSESPEKEAGQLSKGNSFLIKATFVLVLVCVAFSLFSYFSARDMLVGAVQSDIQQWLRGKDDEAIRLLNEHWKTKLNTDALQAIETTEKAESMMYQDKELARMSFLNAINHDPSNIDIYSKFVSFLEAHREDASLRQELRSVLGVAVLRVDPSNIKKVQDLLIKVDALEPSSEGGDPQAQLKQDYDKLASIAEAHLKESVSITELGRDLIALSQITNELLDEALVSQAKDLTEALAKKIEQKRKSISMDYRKWAAGVMLATQTQIDECDKGFNMTQVEAEQILAKGNALFESTEEGGAMVSECNSMHFGQIEALTEKERFSAINIQYLDSELVGYYQRIHQQLVETAGEKSKSGELEMHNRYFLEAEKKPLMDADEE